MLAPFIVRVHSRPGAALAQVGRKFDPQLLRHPNTRPSKI
jgi:hypothetical protein